MTTLQRDATLITQVAQVVRLCASSAAILVCVDGLARDIIAFRRAFRRKARTGQRCRSQLRAEPGLLIGQFVERDAQRLVVSLTRLVAQGSTEAINTVLAQTKGGIQITTAFIERLNATFRPPWSHWSDAGEPSRAARPF